MKKILIAIPTAQNIHPQTFKSIYDLVIPDGYEADFQYFYGYSVDQVRNLIASWVVKSYDYLFAVDYDISFEPLTLVRLLQHDLDVVSGLYIQRKPGEHILEIYRTAENGDQYNVPVCFLRNELEPIDACGFGCVLVKREVLEAVGYPQFFYTHALEHKDAISEDVYFCNKARALGFKIYANTLVRCKHHGSYEFSVIAI